MTSLIPPLLRALPPWLSNYAIAEADAGLAELPAGLQQELMLKLNALPVPQPYQRAVRQATRQALKAWQANPETTSNCLVILSQPVEAIAAIIKASLEDYLLDCDVRFFLRSYRRPPDPLSILSHLQRELEPEQANEQAAPAAPITETDLQEHRPTVMVIPSLEQCFLRCIQGWEGIEYFQQLGTQDTSRFWVFGCNQWAWTFLSKVCQVDAYLEQTVSLPALTDDDLETWFASLMAFSMSRPDADLTLQISPDEAHWSTLASLSSGTSTIAAQLWLQSLRLEETDLTAEGTLPAEVQQAELRATRPSLPSLTSLTVMDRYLLHSLLIHRLMTRSHLALSLGENERTIHSRVQVLQRAGVIVQQGRWLSVHPAHYPKLRSELGNNNFLIGKA
ncbi:MAG: hypothetical protein AAFR26_25555 [Cyanobacteria bacterium J06626_4]